jgi:hypothetical protein
MEADGEDRAYDALSQHPRITDMVAVARTLMAKAVEARKAEREADVLTRLLAEHHLQREDAATPAGNVVDVLEKGPSNPSERSLLCALAAQVVAKNPPQSPEDETRLAGDLLWLAAHTPFDATGLLDRALGNGAAALWDAVAERIRRIDEGQGAPLDRGAALLGAVALRSSLSKDAERHVAALGARTRDPKLANVLATGPGPAAEPPTPVVGEIVPAPQGPVATALLAFSGVLLVLHAARTFGRIALAYRRPAEIRLSEDGGLRVHWRTEILGRNLGDRDILVPRSGLAQATREVRYPRLALYAGLLALSIGSYAGVAAFVDGVRAASPSLLGAGLLIAILGIAIDFVLSSVVPGARARCSVVLVPRRGRRLCVGGVDLQAADAMLARVAHR